MDQRITAIGERRYIGAIDVNTTRRSFGCTGQDQRPRHNYRPQTQYSSKHSLN
jgi:hypothetical protein